MFSPKNPSLSLCAHRRRERGSAGVKFLLVAAFIAGSIQIGYQFVPVAYHANVFKVFMQDTVDKTVALGKKGDYAVQVFRANAEEYELPADAVISVTPQGDRMTARVQYTKKISLLGYQYDYKFDHIVRSSAFFSSTN